MSTISASTTTTTAYKVTADTTGTLVLQTGATPTTAVTIDGSQNVGVGVTPSSWGSPLSNALEMQKGTAFTSNSSFPIAYVTANNYYNGTNWIYKTSAYGAYYSVNGGNGQHQWFTAPSGTAGNTVTHTQAMTLDASGRLLLGTTTSSANAMTVLGSQLSTVFLNNVNDYNEVGVWNNSSGSTYQKVQIKVDATGGQIGTRSNDILRLSTNDTERARIDTSGNLFLGGTTQYNSAKFTISYNGSVNNGLSFIDTTNQTGTGYLSFQNSAGTQIGSVTRVGTTNAVIYNTTSDQRLKSNIENSNPVLNKLMQVQVRQYDWTEGDLHQDYGFIAQELEPLLTGVVTKGKTEEDVWQLDYSRLTPHLVKAIQEQQAIIQAQAADIAALKAKVGI